MENLKIGLSANEISSKVDQLNQTKYSSLLDGLRQRYKTKFSTKSPQEIALINDIDKYVESYIEEILSPIIIEIISENNKKISADIQKLITTK